MKKLSQPFSDTYITQYFHSGHYALDMVSTKKQKSYGLPLVAPEDAIVIRIVGNTYTPEDTSNLKRGYGIFLQGLETGLFHQYWHTQPVCPVSVGQTVKRGKIVAFMGNAGTVRRNGKYVEVGDRLTVEKPGTHLHWEVMKSYDPIQVRKGEHVDPFPLVDWLTPTKYGTFDLLSAVSITLLKTKGLLAKE